MVYIDANVFISAVLYEDSRAAKAKDILVEIAEGRKEAYTSVLTWDELVWIIRKLAGEKKANEEGRKFMEFPNLKFVPANILVINEAQRLAETYGIKPRDAIHVASAVSRGIKQIISDDPDFDAAKEIRRIPL